MTAAWELLSDAGRRADLDARLRIRRHHCFIPSACWCSDGGASSGGTTYFFDERPRDVERAGRLGDLDGGVFAGDLLLEAERAGRLVLVLALALAPFLAAQRCKSRAELRLRRMCRSSEP